MSVSTATLLTKQFYEWERRGRGHTVVEFPAQLEPPFVPFFGHFADSEYLDDGRRHTILSSFRSLFVSDHTVSIPEPQLQETTAYPDDEENPSLSIYTLTIPKGHTFKADSMERCLTMLASCKETIAFEIVANATEIAVQLVSRNSVTSFMLIQLRAYFPECTICETYDDKVLYSAEESEAIYMVDFGLREEFMRPIASLGNSAHDPYTPLFSTIDQLKGTEAIVFQVLFCGTQNAWSESVITSVTDDKGGSFFLDAPEMPSLAKDKVSRPLFGATIRLATFADQLEDAQELLEHSALALINASSSDSNSLIPLSNQEYTIQKRLSDLVLRQSHRVGMLLNTRELATLAHFPASHLSKKLLKGTRTTKWAPTYLQDQPYILGVNEHQGKSAEVGINDNQRLKHIHIIGGTGQGKSTLLHSLICQDLENEVGCCVIDPHGDLIESVLCSVPANRIGDIVLIDPSDGEFPVGFNILSAHTDLERELLASDLVALFRRFSTSWGDQLHSVLANAIMAFLYNSIPGHIGDLRKFLIEPKFRHEVLQTCTDAEVTYYWQKEYPLLKTSSIGSILTRLDGFLRPRLIRNMVCQHKGLDFSALMNGNKIILVKLSQGLIGTENSYLLGALIVSKLQQSAMARQQQSVAERAPFFCYIDEFHHFVTPSMSAILSSARKYSFGLILAHQDMQQVQRQDADVASSIMSNVGTRICFRLGDTDAKRMQDGFIGFTADDFQNLPVGEAIARVNTADADFSLSVIQTEVSEVDYTDGIIENSRKHYSVSIHLSETPTQTQEQTQEPSQNITKSDNPVSSAVPEDVPKREQPLRNTQEHRYMQAFIKTMAEQHGYRAFTEVPTSDGKGQVDVVLERGDERIAVEVSVSTGADWEMGNIRKCLSENFNKIVVCSSDKKKLQLIQQKIEPSLTPAEQSRVVLISSEDVATIFSASDSKTEGETTMKGYRVKVRYEQQGGADASDIVKRIIDGSKK